MSVLPFRKPVVKADYRPDPRNGECYATPCSIIEYVDGVEIESDGGFAVVHMSRSGNSASMDRGYPTMDAALAGALLKAKQLNAVFLSDKGGQH